MYRLFMKVISIIIIIFLFNTEICLANTQSIRTTIEETEDNVTLIASSNIKENIYGFLGSIDYDQDKFILEQCTSSNFTLTQNDKLILLESLVSNKNIELFTCSFKKLEEVDVTDITISNVSISDGKRLLNLTRTHADNHAQEENNKDAINIKYIFLIIVVIILLSIAFILLSYKKTKKSITPIILLVILIIGTLIPPQSYAQTTEPKLNEIRNMLLGKITNTNEYDFDNDKKTTINDLILGLIAFYKIDINFQENNVVGTEIYKVIVISNIKISSKSPIESVHYCFTNDDSCYPNVSYDYKPNDIIKINYPENTEGKRLCLRVKNDLGLEETLCSDEKYMIDNVMPKIKFNNSKVIISEEDIYDTNQNVSVEYGVSGGKYSCTKEYKIGNNTIICNVYGNNGLTSSKKYELVVEATIDMVHFIDSLNTHSTVKIVSNDITILESNGKFGIIDFGYKDNEIDAQKVENYLEKLGIEEFEFAILTHGHADHTGYFEDICKKYKIKKIYMKERIKNYPNTEYYGGYGKVLTTIKEYNIPIKDVENPENQKIVLGDMVLDLYNTKFILDNNDTSRADNANSLVAVANIHGKKVYFAGDIGEYGLLRKGLGVEISTAKKIGIVDVYKVAHHGFMTYQNSLMSLSYLKPTYSVVNNHEQEPQLKGLITKLRFNNQNYKKTYFISNGHITMKFNKDGTININQSY